MVEEESPNKIKESWHVGPFRFLIIALVISQVLLVVWMFLIGSSTADSTERIVIGCLAIVVFIAVVVVFCVVYHTKRKYDEMAFERCDDKTHMHAT